MSPPFFILNWVSGDTVQVVHHARSSSRTLSIFIPFRQHPTSWTLTFLFFKPSCGSNLVQVVHRVRSSSRILFNPEIVGAEICCLWLLDAPSYFVYILPIVRGFVQRTYSVFFWLPLFLYLHQKSRFHLPSLYLSASCFIKCLPKRMSLLPRPVPTPRA